MIEIDRLSKIYDGRAVVDEVSLRAAEGSLTVIVGTSGSGKSTLLRMINRLVEPSKGTVLIDGRDIRTVPGHALRRGIGYVIQGNGLFPHRSVAENIATVPRLLGWTKKRIDDRVDELLALFQLDPATYRGKRPHQLSGGEQQRVGVARALAAGPRLLLMDEPFGALDPLIRAKAQEDLAAIHGRLGTTIVMVTHDLDEAFRLGDRIAVMNGGRIIQEASPADLLTHPAPGYVAQLVASSDRPFRLLALSRVADVVEPAPVAPFAADDALESSLSLREALARMVWRGVSALPVAAPGGGLIGQVSLARILARGRGVS